MDFGGEKYFKIFRKCLNGENLFRKTSFKKISTRSSFLVWWAASVCIAIQIRSNLNLNDVDENEDVEGEDALREGPEKYPP